MTDIIAQGGGDKDPAGRGRRRPSRPGRWRLAWTAATLVVLGGLAVLGVRAGSHRSTTLPATTPAAVEPALAPKLATASPAVPASPAPARRVDLSLLTLGSELGWLATGSGQVSAINGVPDQIEADLTVRLAGGTVVLESAIPACATCRAVTGIAYYVRDGSSRAARIGSAAWLAEATDHHSLWTIGYGSRSAPAPGEMPRQARLIDDSGRPLGPALTLPAGTSLYRGVRGGLLLRTRDGTWEVWNPSDGTVRARFPRVAAASTDHIAWVSGQRAFITELGTGRTVRLAITVPPTAAVNFAAFSPDSGRLAFAVTQYTSTDPAAGIVSNTVALADTASGRLTDVPSGAGFVSGDLSAIGWTPDGHWLLLPTGEGMGRTQVYAWRPGTPSLRTALDNAPWLPVAVGPPPAW